MHSSALAPTLIIVISISQVVFDPALIQGHVESEVARVVGQSGADQVKSMIEKSSYESATAYLRRVLEWDSCSWEQPAYLHNFKRR